MKILYWNLKNNKNIEDIIISCLKENEIDIFFCSEFNNVNFQHILDIEKDYKILDGVLDACKKIKVLYRKSLNINLLQEQHRYLICKLEYSNKKFLLTGVHLPSNPHSNEDDRKSEIRNVVSDIVSNEKTLYKGEENYSIVIGDMNASPFDAEMINKDAFNCVLFKELIKKNKIIKYNKIPRERFYNPIIDFIGESNKIYGSFYYDNGIKSLYWYCYDQILVRQSLVDNIKEYNYLKMINNKSLLNNVMPNKKISDHLPLFVNIDMEV